MPDYPVDKEVECTVLWLRTYVRTSVKMVLRIRKLVIPLLCLSPLFFVDVYCLCENGKGKEGETECFKSVYFGKTIYEPAVCLKRSTIKALTRSLVCRDPNADYCWYHCSVTPTEVGQGKEVCNCDPEKEITPRNSKPLVNCYIPSEADCSWYGVLKNV